MPRKSRKRSVEDAVEDDEASSVKRPAHDEGSEEATEAGEQDPSTGVKEEEQEAVSQKEEEEYVSQKEEEEEISQKEEEEDVSQKEEEEEISQKEEEEISQKEENDDADDEQAGEEEQAAAIKDDEPMTEEGDNDEDEEMEEADNDEEDNNQREEDGKPFRRINAAGKPAECGVIASVYCENFMCHPRLTIDLCRNVNFIHGRNGSGKSAILAAIQICLGANAKRTGRGRNLRDLVRKEAAGRNPNTSAKVRVTLLNGGEDAYKPDLFGDKITVERCISLSGGYNGFKLLDGDGKEVSRNKKDLLDMLDYMNIQVDNPVAILSQEEAKKFLGGKPEDKYRFFTKATELERIDGVYAAITDQHDDIQTKQTTLTESLEAKTEVVKTLRKKVDEFQAVDKLEKQLLDTTRDMAVAFYMERNADFEKAAQTLQGTQEKLEAREQELTQLEEEKASGSNDQDEESRIKETMDELQKEAEIQGDLKRNLAADLKLKQAPIKGLQRDLKSLAAEKKTHAQNLIRAKKRLKDAREEMLAKAGSAESETARRTAELAQIEESLDKAKAELDEIHEAITVSHQEYKEGLPEVEQAKALSGKKKSELDRAKSTLRELQSSTSSDGASIFGQRCSQMKHIVDQHTRNGKFRGQVIGPIGAYLKLAPGKEKYGQLAEFCIGQNSMDRFIVTDQRDVKLVDSIRRQVGCQRDCGVFKVKSSPRYVVPPPPSDQVETVASVLIVENDIVFNCLVDQLNIDRRALAPSKEVSEESLLVSNQNGRYSIKGIINEVVFLPRGDKWSVRDGALSIMSNDRQKFPARKIGVDLTSAIEERQEEVRTFDKELKELRAAESDLSRESNRLKKLWNEKQREKRNNEVKDEKLRERKERIELELETTADTAMDTTELEDDVAKAEEQLNSVNEKETNIRKDIEEKQPEIQDVRNRLEEVQARNDKVLQDMQKAAEDLDACVQRMDQSQAILDKKREKVQKTVEIAKKRKEEFEKREKERENALTVARKLTLQAQLKEERDKTESAGCAQEPSQAEFTEDELANVEIVAVDKEHKYYEAKMKRVKAKIEKELERRDLSNEDPTEAIEKLSRAKDDLRSTQEAVDKSESTLRVLRRDMKKRRQRFDDLKDYLARMTHERFDSILHLNNASGSLEFDDDKKQLNLVVQKSAKDPNSQTKDVKSLSGGERSFTTISLLLALGESLETPFRVFDEFDVFLDTQARKLAIKTLIHIAKKMEHRQFVFITPQDLSSVTPDPQLKVFKLKNPRSSEEAGGLTQSHLD
ncbi:of chromosomes protein 6 [Seminavis robusta]|uniref:Of chromosomes protein 6 n=1 Tax=Seminavis robusta TaxID=568900 RepID=A0A9N8E502_9STRA|nr:of chromosomes protein 6 [Seminavis robusta]|eukprot:Sro665_g183900.1 of chromosomes protein 6 (1276) ;mRNA; f:43606-48124